MNKRFRDYHTGLSDFETLVWLECPRCGKAARSICLDRKMTWRLTCLHCTYTHLASRKASKHRSQPWEQRNWWTRMKAHGGAVDRLFGLPLWFRVPCAGSMLWAYNLDHLTLLEQYVQATLRERQGSTGNHHSIAVRLPRWMKLAHNREAILKAIQLLKTKSVD